MLDGVGAHVDVLRVAAPEVVVGNVAAEARPYNTAECVCVTHVLHSRADAAPAEGSERDPGTSVVLHHDLTGRVEVVQPAAEPAPPKLAVITSDCGSPRSLNFKWPESPRIVAR